MTLYVSSSYGNKDNVQDRFKHSFQFNNNKNTEKKMSRSKSDFHPQFQHPKSKDQGLKNMRFGSSKLKKDAGLVTYVRPTIDFLITY